VKYKVGAHVGLTPCGVEALAVDASSFSVRLSNIVGVVIRHREPRSLTQPYPYEVLWEKRINIIHSTEELRAVQQAKIVGNELILEEP